MTGSHTKGSPGKRKAAYISIKGLMFFLDHIRYVSTPNKVDAGLLHDYGTSKGNVFALLSALKFLGLIDENGKPTPAFGSLQAMGQEFQGNLREVVENAYADLFTRLDVSRDSREHVRNYFARNYSVSQSERATSLFLDLCREAGIDVARESRGGKAEAAERAMVSQPVARRTSPTPQSVEPPVVEHEGYVVMSDDELRKLYLRKLIDQVSPPDTAGKDAEAIKAEAELRKAELDRIEQLLKIRKGKDKEESAEEELPF